MGSPRYLIVSTVSSFVPASQQQPKQKSGHISKNSRGSSQNPFVIFFFFGGKRAQVCGQRQNAKLYT